MERQAIRRVEHGAPATDEEERIGITLVQLNDRMTHLLDCFGLTRQGLTSTSPSTTNPPAPAT